MKKSLLFNTIGMFLLLASCTGTGPKETANVPSADSLLAQAKTYFQPLPGEAVNPENPITPEKVALGKQLYCDNRLSMHNTESCNTCHNLSTYGVDLKATSPGDNGKNGNRNSPSSFNAALHFVQFWDGRMKDVEEQAGGPVMNPAEMSMPNEKEVMSKLSRVEGYKKMFAAAYPDQKNPVTFENMRKAIAAFERKLITPGKFDKFLAGDTRALDTAELRGLKTYMETGCTTCHTGSLLGGGMFQKYPLFGNHKDYTGSATDDPGRMQATKNEADKYMFKVPSLRNIAETHPYFHDGSVTELGKAVIIMAKAQLNKDLTPDQVNDLVAFLKALTGEVPADAKELPAEI
ncbi:MAG TPA: cytochrome c peroxidase [Bacteroidales bacterium]|nr:cytochrome c peroxidase [Bacteroidales bacterium]